MADKTKERPLSHNASATARRLVLLYITEWSKAEVYRGSLFGGLTYFPSVCVCV